MEYKKFPPEGGRNPAGAGLNPKHTINAFSICFIEIVMGKGRN